MASMRARVVKGAVFITVARAITNGLGFISTIVLARILVPADFGLVALATSTLAIVSALTEIQMSRALVQHPSPTREHLDTAWTFGLLRSLLIAGALALISFPLSEFYSEPRLVGLILVLDIGVILTGLKNPRSVMLTRDLIFWQQCVLQISERLVSAAAAIALALIYQSYWALIIGAIMGQFVGLVFSYCLLPFRPRVGWKNSQELFSFSIWLMGCQVVNTINWRFDHFLIGWLFGPARLGIYTMGDKLATMPTREVTTPINATLFPALSRLIHDSGKLKSAYQSAQVAMTTIALPAGVGVALIADPLVQLTMGEKWHGAVLVIQVLSAVFACQTIGSLAQALAMAAGETRLIFKRDLQGFVLRFPCIAAGWYLAGFEGIVYARVFSGLFTIFLNMTVVRKLASLSISEQLRPNLCSIFSVAVMAIATVLVDSQIPRSAASVELGIRIAILVAAGALVYSLTWVSAWAATGKPNSPESQLPLAVARTVGLKLPRFLGRFED